VTGGSEEKRGARTDLLQIVRSAVDDLERLLLFLQFVVQLDQSGSKLQNGKEEQRVDMEAQNRTRANGKGAAKGKGKIPLGKEGTSKHCKKKEKSTKFDRRKKRYEKKRRNNEMGLTKEKKKGRQIKLNEDET
jgi:hypothetical protein